MFYNAVYAKGEYRNEIGPIMKLAKDDTMKIAVRYYSKLGNTEKINHPMK